MLDASPEQKPVPAIVRAKLVVDAVADAAQPMSGSELARELGLPRSTTHGICSTLEKLGLLVRVGENRFSVGPHVLTWSNAFDAKSSLSQAFHAVAKTMPGPQAINLSILTGREVMYVGCRPGSDPLGVRFREGLRFPAAFTATGKAMMSTMTDDEVATLLEGHWPPPATPASVRDLSSLMQELAVTGVRGYSIDNGQLREAMICFGAPVFAAASAGRAVAGVAIGVLASGVSDAHAQEMGQLARGFGSEVSRRLGGSTG